MCVGAVFFPNASFVFFPTEVGPVGKGAKQERPRGGLGSPARVLSPLDQTQLGKKWGVGKNTTCVGYQFIVPVIYVRNGQ